MSPHTHSRWPLALAALVFMFCGNAVAAEPGEPPPITVPPLPPLPDPNAPGSSDEFPKPDPGLGKIKIGPTEIDQYPQNPRCYVGGVYVPAPPLCPN